ncbi:MAG: hypothetical protein ABI430_02925 [Candidatus Taylorbacteria bacterium]
MKKKLAIQLSVVALLIFGIFILKNVSNDTLGEPTLVDSLPEPSSEVLFVGQPIVTGGELTIGDVAGTFTGSTTDQITYTSNPIPDSAGLFVHTMSGSFGIQYATTSSSANPFSSCEKEFEATRPEVISISSPDSSWIDFSDKKYGYTFKMPKHWTVSHIAGYSQENTKIDFSNHAVIITKIDSAGDNLGAGGVLVCNQSDFSSIKIDSQYISRSKTPTIYEMSTEKYFNFCIMGTASDNGCRSPIKLGSNFYQIDYVLEKGDTFDSKLLKDMDTLVSTLKARVN